MLAAGAPGVSAASPQTPAASPEQSPAQAASTLTVSSQPVGAAVFVDGERKGETPLAIGGLAAGQHQVRLVKDGHLENSRTVTLAPGGASLEVALTPAATGSRPTATVEPGAATKTGSSKRKWLLIGIGAAAVGAGGYLALRDTNKAPLLAGVTANPSLTLQGIDIAFAANASDSEGDPLTYSWSYDDGTTGRGPSPKHAFDGPGSFDVSVEVSDGKKTTKGSTVALVLTMAGNWRGAVDLPGHGSLTFGLNLGQSGASVTGAHSDYEGAGSVTGTVSAPLDVRLTIRQGTYAPFVLSGSVSPDGNSVSGSVTNLVAPGSFRLARQ